MFAGIQSAAAQPPAPDTVHEVLRQERAPVEIAIETCEVSVSCWQDRGGDICDPSYTTLKLRTSPPSLEGILEWFGPYADVGGCGRLKGGESVMVELETTLIREISTDFDSCRRGQCGCTGRELRRLVVDGRFVNEQVLRTEHFERGACPQGGE